MYTFISLYVHECCNDLIFMLVESLMAGDYFITVDSPAIIEKV